MSRYSEGAIASPIPKVERPLEPEPYRGVFIYRNEHDSTLPFGMAVGSELDNTVTLLDCWTGRDFEAQLEDWSNKQEIKTVWLHQTPQSFKKHEIYDHPLYHSVRDLSLWPQLADRMDPHIAWIRLHRKYSNNEVVIKSSKIEAFLRSPNPQASPEQIALAGLALMGCMLPTMRAIQNLVRCQESEKNSK